MVIKQEVQVVPQPAFLLDTVKAGLGLFFFEWRTLNWDYTIVLVGLREEYIEDVVM